MSEFGEAKGEIKVDDREIARLNAVQEHAVRSKAMDLGKIGVWLGSRENASIYLAAITILFSGSAAVGFAVVDPTIRPDIAKSLLGIAILAAGYMFGASKGSGGHSD
jgi:hypothetical protein